MKNYWMLYRNAIGRMNQLDSNSAEWEKAEKEMKEIFYEGLEANEPHIVSDAIEGFISMVENGFPHDEIEAEYQLIKKLNQKAAIEILEYIAFE